MTIFNYSNTIPVYAINLKERKERKNHTKNEFYNKKEFNLVVIDAIKDSNGAYGLWKTIIQVVRQAKSRGEEYILICEDDHQFTEYYNYQELLNLISITNQCHIDVLLGGVSWYQAGIPILENLILIDKFTGLQFTIIFASLYDRILDCSFKKGEAADLKISELAIKKAVIFPFISNQKEFGYSDVTSTNKSKGHVTNIFKTSSLMLNQLFKAKEYYIKLGRFEKAFTEEQCDEIVLPAFVLNISNRENLKKAFNQFSNRKEFSVKFLFQVEHLSWEQSFWHNLKKVVSDAIEEDDDFIIICKEGHNFTTYYSKLILIRNILDANDEGADFLFANANKFRNAVAISRERYWINPIGNSSFFIVYRRVYKKILSYVFDSNDNIFNVISNMTSNKILLFPYLSYDFDLVKKDSSKNRLLNTNSQSAGEIIYIFEELMIKYSSILNKNYLL